MNWIKSHKLVVGLLVVIAFFLLKDNFLIPSFKTISSTGSYGYNTRSLSSVQLPEVDTVMPLLESSSKTYNGTNRIVIQESNMSLLVTDVRDSGDKILTFAKNNGGYMVQTSYTRPTESPFAYITIRIPANKLDQALSYFRSLAVKVTNENLIGTDVTQEYTDIEARLTTLRKTQAKFEDILDKAISVQDILTVQRELINLQDQIDSLIGQQKAMGKNAELTKITIYLSTDELALPYTPDNAFRPGVVFKYAVRSLLNTLRIGAEALIWIAVYSPVIIIVILIYIFLKRWTKKRNPTINKAP
jgi:hypothetical protein